jgi:hypothetical protein
MGSSTKDGAPKLSRGIAGGETSVKEDLTVETTSELPSMHTFVFEANANAC